MNQQKDELAERAGQMELAMLEGRKSTEALNEQQALTKELVDQLIDNIDILVKPESQQ